MDNAQDKIQKGRQRHGHLYGDDHPLRKHPEWAARGEQHGGAILTWDKVREIRALCAEGTLTHEAIGQRFGVSRPTVTAIHCGRLWKDDGNGS